MPSNASALPPVFLRRRARRLAVWNGAVWAVGNGLAGATLVVYLARELHSERFGLTVGLIVAAPHVAGLLRLAAPALIERLGDRKRFCIASFLLSTSDAGGRALGLRAGRLPSPGWSLAALIVLWCLFHLLQYLGTVALWSWLADVAPSRIRGRFLGRRERWMVAGTAAAAIDVGLFIWGISQTYPGLPRWMPYGIAAGLGAAFMLASLVPLCKMPAMASNVAQPLSAVQNRSAQPRAAVPQQAGVGIGSKSLLKPFFDRRFLPLLLFGCWFSLFNGITQSAQRFFPVEVLGLPLLVMISLETGTRLGQWTVSPRLGTLADRFGNRPVMIVCQLLVAAGLLFYAVPAAAQASWTWLIGAWVLWIAYAGINVCLPNLMLKLSPRETNAAYIAAFQAAGGLCYAASSILGGALVDWGGSAYVSIGGAVLPVLAILFLFGWATRCIGAAILLLVRE